MKNKGIENRLNIVLRNLGVDTVYYSNIISSFKQRIEFLSSLGNYNKLIKYLFSSKKESTFNSYAFEALFAYDFESKGNRLNYEVRQLSTDLSSVDFCYTLDNQGEIYFELRLINNGIK